MSCMHNVHVVLDQVPVLLTLGNIGQCSLHNVLTLLLSSHLKSVSLLLKKRLANFKLASTPMLPPKNS